MNTYNNFSKGSEWRKWDLHFHTSSSYDYGDKSITNEDIINVLCKNEISVVCITDHNVIDTNRIKTIQTLGAGKIVVLPGIEFCSELGGSEAVHFIGIFPENSEIESIWTKIQGNLNLTPKDVTDKGGHEKIQCDLIDTCDLIHELGGITSIHAGTKTNTVENIKNTLLVKMEQKRRILSECIDILELGKPEDVKNYELIVFKNIRFKLPMIICSDNHNIKNYEIKCNCWIRADPTFEGLRQIIYEPINRVSIGVENPDLYRENCINSITVEKDCFPQKTLPINNGIVSIIGARGSGKTALLDFIALGANVYCKNKANFLFKAQKEILPLSATIDLDGNKISQNFNPDYEYLEHRVKYLSQQFVESLCSENGSTERLQMEIERFIFEGIDSIERLETRNFSELKGLLCKSSENTIEANKNKILELNKKISQIYHMKTVILPTKENEKKDLLNELNILKTKLPKLDKTAQGNSLLEYEMNNNQKIKLESELKLKYSQIKKFEQIYNEIINFNKVVFDKNYYFKNELLNLGVDDKMLLYFDIQYYDSIIKDIFNIIDSKRTEYNKEYGDEISPNEGTYRYLIQKQNILQKRMEEYTENEKYYLETSKRIEQTNIVLVEIDNQINSIKQMDIVKVQKERLELYKQIFEEIKKIKSILESLFLPLVKQLENKKQEKQLGFFVKINANINSWVLRGEELIDLRRAKEFRDNESLFHRTKNKLYSIWEDCDPERIEKAIDDFTNNEAKLMREYLLKPSSLVGLADWLFSIDHISISYEMTFNKIPLKLLSPGTKGILLMLLYLGVDKNDTRPLLIDQPEDNLDPESVYNVLVPYFVEAKKRRQIIMVTHNPNLVIATDSDQVIVADCKTKETSGLPIFTYSGGGLENREIVTKICNILEGGEEAFIKRAQRYRVDFKNKQHFFQNNSKKEE